MSGTTIHSSSTTQNNKNLFYYTRRTLHRYVAKIQFILGKITPKNPNQTPARQELIPRTVPLVQMQLREKQEMEAFYEENIRKV